jgi:hypothetical protein
VVEEREESHRSIEGESLHVGGRGEWSKEGTPHVGVLDTHHNHVENESHSNQKINEPYNS